MKLTARQKEILGKLMDIYRDNKQAPIHYSVIAKKLGISKWSAYDMMRVLEGKGLVKANYKLTGKSKSRGRTAVYFSPTDASRQIINEVLNKILIEQTDQKEWLKIRSLILKHIKKLEGTDKEPLLKSILGILNNEKTK